MLPEKAKDQIWSYILGDNIYRYKLTNKSTTISGWDGISMNIGIYLHAPCYLHDADLAKAYYVGVHPIDFEKQVEPAVGQFWIDKDYQVQLISYDSKQKLFNHEESHAWSAKYLKENFAFVGWYDTSLLKTESGVDIKRYPHKCPRCKYPAYIGFNMIDCIRGEGCRK